MQPVDPPSLGPPPPASVDAPASVDDPPSLDPPSDPLAVQAPFEHPCEQFCDTVHAWAEQVYTSLPRHSVAPVAHPLTQAPPAHDWFVVQVRVSDITPPVQV